MKCCNCNLSIGVCCKFDSFEASFLVVFLDLNYVLNVFYIMLLLEVTNLSFLFNSDQCIIRISRHKYLKHHEHHNINMKPSKALEMQGNFTQIFYITCDVKFEFCDLFYGSLYMYVLNRKGFTVSCF